MGKQHDHGSNPLTAQQRQILRLVAEGSTDAKIAVTVHASERTVRRRLREIGQLIGRSSRAGIVAEAMRRGWLPPDGAS
jgi:two-component system, NarL family, response regulator DesR